MRLIDADEIMKLAEPYPHVSAVFRQLLRNIKTIDAVPVRHGKWIDTELTINYLLHCTCSVCGERQIIEVANYCPMCGAKLDAKGEDT